jgi:hypothetical protein
MHDKECLPQRVADLRVGDRVDLESCPHLGHKDGWWQYEYATVGHIERETSDCICIWWDGADNVGYSPNQMLMVAQDRRSIL